MPRVQLVGLICKLLSYQISLCYQKDLLQSTKSTMSNECVSMKPIKLVGMKDTTANSVHSAACSRVNSLVYGLAKYAATPK